MSRSVAFTVRTSRPPREHPPLFRTPRGTPAYAKSPPAPRCTRSCVPVLFALLSVCGCAPPEPPSVVRWSASAPGSSGSGVVGAEVQPAIDMIGARNEWLTTTVDVSLISGFVDAPRVTIEPLVSPGAALPLGVMRAYRVVAVPLPRKPGWAHRYLPTGAWRGEVDDLLVPIDAPIGALPPTLRAGEVVRLFVEVHIPADAPPGLYKGAISIGGDGAESLRHPIRLEIVPVTLPNHSSLPIVASLDHRRLVEEHISADGQPLHLLVDDWQARPEAADIDRLIVDTYAELVEHRITPILSSLAPPIRMAGGDLAHADWAQHDALLRKITRRIGSTPGIWALSTSRIAERAASASNKRQGTSANWFPALLREFIEHAQEVGVWDATIAPLPGCDQMHVSFPSSAASVLEIADEARVRFPWMTTAAPASSYAPGMRLRLDDMVIASLRVVSPRARYFSRPVMQELRSLGIQTWMATDDPPFTEAVSLAPAPVDARLAPWQAKWAGADALYVSANGPNHPSDRAAADGAGRPIPSTHASGLLYSGAPFGLDHPVPSLRLKRLRRGALDLAYLDLLHEQGLPHIAETLLRAIVFHSGGDSVATCVADGRGLGWVSGEDALDRARSIVMNELRPYRTSQHRREDLSATLAWRRLMDDMSRIELDVDGCRARSADSGAEGVMEVECFVTIANRSRTPIVGRLTFSELANPWEAVGENRSIRVEPFRFARAGLRATLRAGVAAAPLTSSMQVELLGVDDTPLASATGRIGVALSESASRNLVLDGALTDWPAGGLNVLKDFSALGESEEPPAQTFALVLRDDTHLHVGISSAFPPGSAPPLTTRNTVDFDAMVPVNEELVAVLIDPLNVGTRLPDDVLQIIVKPSGSYVALRGVPDPDLPKPANRWDSGVGVATSMLNDRWTAELRIPLAALGILPQESRTIGLNVLRYDKHREEVSTWSGARRNAYDPLSFGNLVTMPPNAWSSASSP